jgi:hypothetical protein
MADERRLVGFPSPREHSERRRGVRGGGKQMTEDRRQRTDSLTQNRAPSVVCRPSSVL